MNIDLNKNCDAIINTKKLEGKQRAKFSLSIVQYQTYILHIYMYVYIDLKSRSKSKEGKHRSHFHKSN